MDCFREEVRELQIGFKIRRIRQERRMTLQALADATGLSKPLLSQIENEQVIPPLATLLRIAKAFHVQLQSFFQKEGSSARCVLTKAGDSVYYDSTEPHAFIAKGTVRPRAVAVIFSRN